MTTTHDEHAAGFLDAVKRHDAAAALAVAMNRVSATGHGSGLWIEIVPRIVIDEGAEFRIRVRLSPDTGDREAAEVEVAWPVEVGADADSVAEMLVSLGEFAAAARSDTSFRAYAISLIGAPAGRIAMLVRRPSGEEFSEPFEGIARLATLIALSVSPPQDWVRHVDRLHQELAEATVASQALPLKPAWQSLAVHGVARGVEGGLREALHRW